MTTTEILASIEAIENYAASLEAADNAARERLARIIRGLARIANHKQPFRRKATRFQDEDGHWDNSYPPDKVYCARTGPRLMTIVSYADESIATSGGFYHDWRVVTTDPGLYIAADGTLYGCEITGTGRVGQFAARPGDCGVDCDLEWSTLSIDDVPIDRLQLAVKELVAIAFPAAAESEAGEKLAEIGGLS